MRNALGMFLLILSLGAGGCRMCANCFDCDGPVHEPGYANDGTYGRAGSAFGGQTMIEGEEVIVGEEVVVEDEVLVD